MQQSRRTTPYPYTWEIPLTATITVVTTLVLAAHTARTLANAFAGAGWDFTPQAELFTALPGILGGDARAGLDRGASASPALLYTCLVVVELLVRCAHRLGGHRRDAPVGSGPGAGDGHPRRSRHPPRPAAVAEGRARGPPRPARQGARR
jgi:hypothetical protein